jgi:hypothetical protein
MADIVLDTSVVKNGNGVNSFVFPAITTAQTNEVLICQIHFSNGTPSGVTFSGSLTWTQIGTPITITTAGGKLYVYYAIAASVQSAVSFTATFTGGGFPQVSGILAAYKNCDVSGTPYGATQTGNVGSATTVSATLTTTRANSLVIGCAGQTANQAMGPGTSQSEANETTSAGGFSRSNQVYQNAVTTGSGSSVTASATAASNTSFAIRGIELLAPVASFIAPSKKVFQAVNRAAYY